MVPIFFQHCPSVLRETPEFRGRKLILDGCADKSQTMALGPHCQCLRIENEHRRKWSPLAKGGWWRCPRRAFWWWLCPPKAQSRWRPSPRGSFCWWLCPLRSRHGLGTVALAEDQIPRGRHNHLVGQGACFPTYPDCQVIEACRFQYYKHVPSKPDSHAPLRRAIRS